MTNLLHTRLTKLEASVAPAKANPRIVRIVGNQGEEEEIYRQAAEMGLDTSPDSKDLLIIRLICRPDGAKTTPRRDPEMAAIEREHVAALLAAVDGKTRSK
ncbi:hypothetical protein P6U16_08725 [Rhizobium sp. 32-5/1]|uniref:hypothetical protein n=1 Tax=Rhizobium sp. 32-5/1 TaxID=3019602 RepID=UPI00240E0A2E|nr:hypothetical protein [Rhizobium sp. 32-5/1]WEZ84639.1 hypothetical protein P6U16_08725 [Rhizobium sp. 32-5/1]